jgi:hypothetical protein
MTQVKGCLIITLKPPQMSKENRIFTATLLILSIISLLWIVLDAKTRIHI